MRVKITDINPRDAHFPMRRYMLGLTGEFRTFYDGKEWQGGKLTLDTPFKLPTWSHAHREIIFAFCKFEILDDKPDRKITASGLLWEYLKMRWRALWS